MKLVVISNYMTGFFNAMISISFMKCHERLKDTAASNYEYYLQIFTSVADPSLQTIDGYRSDKYEFVS
jgi:hypothetical protein